MKKLLLLFLPLLLVLSTVRGQTITQTPGVPHTTGTPTGAPSPLTKASWLRFDKTNKILYQWTGAAWTRVVGTVADGDKGDITVSSSGTNWQLDAGSVGNTELATGVGGIYKGSGTIANSCVATIDNQFIIASAGNPRITALESGGYLNSEVGVNAATIGASDVGASMFLSSIGEFKLTSSGIAMQDFRATPRGIEYSADYSATYNDRSLVDFGSVKGLISDSLAAGGSPTLQQVALAGNETTLSIIANTVNVKNDNEFAGVIEASELTVDRTFSLPNRSGFVRVGENYKVYTALLTQSGTSAPVATVLENTLGGTVVWSYTASGDYLATLSGVFTVGKTWAMIAPYGDNGPSGIVSAANVSANSVRIVDLNGDAGLSNTPIEIRVYP